jgi:hypothetical protein
MPSGQDHISRLREEIHRLLATHMRGFQEELRSCQTSLAASLASISQSLEPSPELEAPALESIVAEAIAEESREGSLRRAEEMLSLARFTYAMRRKETQDEILGSLLDHALRYAPKLALFVTRAQHFMGWSSRGFAPELAGGLERCRFPFAESPILQRALEADGLTTANDLVHETALSGLLSEDVHGPVHAFPMRALGRPVAILLAAPAAGRSCDLESICFLMDITGLGIENVALKVLNEMKVAKPAVPAPAPPLRAAGETAAAAVPVTLAKAPEETPEPSHAAATEEVAPAATVPLAEVGAASAEEKHPLSFTPAQPEVPAAESSSAPPPESWEARRETMPPEPPADLESAAAAESAKPGEPETEAEIAPHADRQDAAEVPTPGSETAEPVRGTILREVQPLTEEEKLHADAKRFARLLASEIKLYNEQRVQEGRANRDLYVRLKRDIDRSRDMYEKRVSPLVSRRVDYFHDEIIRVLGDNDPSTLGSDYPGPRVES